MDKDVKELMILAYEGDAQAQIRLGFKYYNGDGIELNSLQAYLWLFVGYHNNKLTSARDRRDVSIKLKDVESRLNAQALEELRKKAKKMALAIRNKGY